MHMEVRALFGRFVLRGVNITIHPSRGSRINPSLKRVPTQPGRTRFSLHFKLLTAMYHKV